MQFRLVYEGQLLGQNGGAAHKWHIRKALHPQLAKLWQQEPLLSAGVSLLASPPIPAKSSSIRQRGIVCFAPLVTFDLRLFAEVNVLLFRGCQKGSTDRSDADNQLKTLLDALRMPSPAQKVEKSVGESLGNPFFCLLEDDCLVTKVSLETDQWLSPRNSDDTLAIIEVHIKKAMTTFENIVF